MSTMSKDVQANNFNISMSPNSSAYICTQPFYEQATSTNQTPPQKKLAAVVNIFSFPQKRVFLRTLIPPTLRSLVTEFTNQVLRNQLELTSSQASDRKGNHSKTPLGFPGLSCIHCQFKNKCNNPGRYFPTTVNTFANHTTIFVMYKHLRNGCDAIPPDEVKQNLTDAYKNHGNNEIEGA